MNMLNWAENGRLADWMVRFGIRRLLKKRIESESKISEADREAWLKSLAVEDMTVGVDEANRQHYEVPPELFQICLGPRLKYSCSIWDDPARRDDLGAAEEHTLQLTCERARLADGQRILELGCGWGSLTLWMAEKYPDSEIVAVSNSSSQREFISVRCRERGLHNVVVLTADVAQFEPPRTGFDRVVSVEMFEHVRNHSRLLQRISEWLHPEGLLFTHIFCHRQFAYPFDDQGPNDWMAREFFTGGVMPSFDLLPQSTEAMKLVERWKVSGLHYQATSEAWLDRLDANRERVEAVLSKAGWNGTPQAQRWRMFFMACAELFGYDGGEQWHVGHYLFEVAT